MAICDSGDRRASETLYVGIRGATGSITLKTVAVSETTFADPVRHDRLGKDGCITSRFS